MSLLPNTVINGNCLEVMKEIDDASIDMILCDLPYGGDSELMGLGYPACSALGAV